MLLTEDQAERISADGLVHDAQRLKELQSLPLYRKVGITIARITEWYQHWDGNVYVSFSGGKDSTVLLHLVRSIFPDVPAVFSNTGLEYPEIQKFVKSFDNVTTIYPKMKFTDVIGTYGYPLIGKEVSEAIYYARRNSPPQRQKTEGPPRRRLEMLGLREDTKRQLPNNESSLGQESRIRAEQLAHTHTHTMQETVWCNPPYGREIGRWVEKAYNESLKGVTVVMLLPARTDTKWFHDFIYGKAEIRFVRGRLKFGDSKNSAPFPSMVVIFKGTECDKI